MQIVIPLLPPSNNKNQGHSGKALMYEYQRAKKLFEEYVFYLADKPASPYEKAVVVIDYYFKDGRRRDADNYSGKMVHDALVRTGILRDDSYRNMVSLVFFHTDKNQPRTVVTVVPKDELETVREQLREVLLGGSNGI